MAGTLAVMSIQCHQQKVMNWISGQEVPDVKLDSLSLWKDWVKLTGPQANTRAQPWELKKRMANSFSKATGKGTKLSF